MQRQKEAICTGNNLIADSFVSLLDFRKIICPLFISEFVKYLDISVGERAEAECILCWGSFSLFYFLFFYFTLFVTCLKTLSVSTIL
jgi:hypothetical protein